MFHAGEHDLIALEAGALDRSHERAAHIIRLEVSYWHLSDMPTDCEMSACRPRPEVIGARHSDAFDPKQSFRHAHYSERFFK
jgi:hypothetical protein